MKLGFIGIGLMGKPMTLRLLAAGHEVVLAVAGQNGILLAVMLDEPSLGLSPLLSGELFRTLSAVRDTGRLDNFRRSVDGALERLAGDELDAFACEVAALSLILADYPNANGWRIHEVDLFEDDRIAERARRGCRRHPAPGIRGRHGQGTRLLPEGGPVIPAATSGPAPHRRAGGR